MANKRMFSLYDIEKFLRDAGAERINERAIISLEKELQDIAQELVEEAHVYANYAGRRKLIDASDIHLASNDNRTKRYIKYKGRLIRKTKRKQIANRIVPAKLMLINNVAVIKEEHIIQ